jgi:hypothetical protein
MDEPHCRKGTQRRQTQLPAAILTHGSGGVKEKACGLYFSQGIVWDKQHPVLTRKDGRGTRVERVAFTWERGKIWMA